MPFDRPVLFPRSRALAGALIGSALLGAVSPVLAAEPHRGTAEEQAACLPDVFRLCAADIPDEGPILACLRRNVPHLSIACGRVIAPRPLRAAGRSTRT